MSILLPAIWTQLGCKQSMAEMMKYTKDMDECQAMDQAISNGEPSEEIRLLMIKLLTVIMANNQSKFITLCQTNQPLLSQKYLNIVHVLFSDKCPEILSMTIQLMLAGIEEYQKSNSSKQTNEDSSDTYKRTDLFQLIFDDYAEYLCIALGPICAHNRGKIRLCALKLLSKIIEQHMTIKQGIPRWITDDDKIWKYIFRFIFEQIPSVQQQLALSALKWLKLAVSMYNERVQNEDVSTTQNPTDFQMAKLWMLLLNDTGVHALNHQQEVDVQQELLHSIGNIFPCVTEQLGHWKTLHQNIGYKAIAALLICLEDRFPGEFVVKLLPFFESMNLRNEEDVHLKQECLRLFGQFVSIKHYDTFLFEQIAVQSNTGYLMMTAEIFKGFIPDQMDQETLLRICKALSSSSSSRSARELLDVLRILLVKCAFKLSDECIEEILWIILQIQTARTEKKYDPWCSDLDTSLGNALYGATREILRQVHGRGLVECFNVQLPYVVPATWNRHFAALYQRNSVDMTCSEAAKRRRSYLAFAWLTWNVRFFLGEHMEMVYSAFQQCNDEGKEDAIQMIIMSTLWRSLGAPTGWKSEWVEKMVMEILLPNMTWKVGKLALDMRLLALNSMLRLYQNSTVNTDFTWKYREKLISALKQRMDDTNEQTRIDVVRTLRCILVDLGESRCSGNMLSDSEVDQLTETLVQRFDDSADEVREVTSDAVAALVQCLNRGNEIHSELYAIIVRTALLHLDDENECLQQKVADLLEGIAGFDKAIFREKIGAVHVEHVRRETRVLLEQRLLSKMDIDVGSNDKQCA